MRRMPEGPLRCCFSVSDYDDGVSHSVRGQSLSPSTRKAYYLWGRGPIARDLAAYLRCRRFDDRNEIARRLALRHGCPVGIVEGAWAASVIGVADDGEFDKLTQDDPSVMGWTEDRGATCPPSLALCNALNSLKLGERDGLTFAVTSAFLPPGTEAEHIRNRRDLVARDGRRVVFDEARSRWHLGEFTT
jgi:hypothetical protein